MPAQEEVIPLPLGGLHKGLPVADQPFFTFRSGANVRPTNKAGRAMLSARNGYSAFFSGYVSAQDSKVQALASIAYNSRHVDYDADTTPDETFGLALLDGSTIGRVHPGLYDDFFFIESNRALTRVNRYGVVLSRIDLPAPSTPLTWSLAHTHEVVGMDEDGAVFVAAMIHATGFTNFGSIFKYVPDLAEPEKMVLQWRIPAPRNAGPTNFGGFCVRAIGYQGKIYCAVNDAGGTSGTEIWSLDNVTTPTGPTAATQRQLLAIIEGATLDTPLGLTTVWAPGVLFAHDMDLRTNGPLEIIVCGGNDINVASTAYFLIKLTNTGGTSLGGTWEGSSNYAVSNDGTTALDTAPPDMIGGGIGYACRFNSAGHVLSMGPRNTNDPPIGNAGTFFRYIVDTGTAWAVASGGAWQAAFATYIGAAGNALQYGYPVFDVDSFGNPVVPTCRNTAGVRAAHVFNAAGTLLASIGHQVGAPAAATNNACRSAVWASTEPVFETDDTPKMAEIAFLGGSAVTTLTATLAGAHGYRVLASSARTDSPRDVAVIAVSGGSIVKLRAGLSPVSPTNDTARSTPLSADARFVSVCALQGKLYFTDGIDYAIYDPTVTVADPYGTITNLNPTTLGIVPPRARLMCSWRSRLVLARFPDAPFNWHMSAFGDPLDWDLFPSADPLATQSVAGNVSPAGLTPDIVNALIPYSDDFLVFGGDHSIRVLAGDPMAGGRVGLVSDETGMAFGSPWCKDTEGRVYFFGSRGGIYAMSPSAMGVEHLTRDTIDADLAGIDLGSNYVSLVWNARDNGLHVFVMPYGVGGTQLTHYFWSRRTGGWFPDTFGSASDTGVQPTAACVIDGDLTDDRAMLIGTEDGRVLIWDLDATRDDDMPIGAHVMVGPFVPKSIPLEVRFMRPSVVLERTGGGAHVGFYVADDDTLPTMPVARWKLNAGRNPYLPLRARGSYCYIELKSTDSSWAVESLAVEVAAAGRKRIHA